MLINPHTIEQFWHNARSTMSNFGDRRLNFWLFESSVWFHMLGNSMIAIYIPILMLQSGFELSAILFFYFIFHLINTPANVLGGYLVAWFGARKTIILATISQIAFFIYYANLEPGSFAALIVLGSLAAIYDALYYTASLYLFMRATVDADNSGKNTGILYAVIRSAGLVGPLVGSTILVLGGGQAWVITAVIASFVVSIIPLFYTNLEQGQRARMSSPFAFLAQPRVLANHLSLGLFKIHESIGGVIWPVFIFLYFGTLESIAILAVLVPIVALAASFFSGRISLGWRHHAIALGALLMALVWIGRIGLESGAWYYFSVVAAGLLIILMQVPIDSNIFHTGNQSNPLVASVVKNMFSMGTKALLFGILYLLSLSFTSTFIIAIAALVLLLGQTMYHILNSK